MMFTVSGCSKTKEPIQNDYVSIPAYETLDADTASVDKDEIQNDVEQELQNLIDQHTTYTDVEGRGIEAGDSVVIDYIMNTTVESEFFVGGPVKDSRIEVGDEYAPIFAESLIGHQVGDVYTWEGTLPDNYAPEALAGTDVSFDITVKAVQTANVPEINDAFAAEVSKTATTVKELKKELTERMTDIQKQDLFALTTTEAWIKVLNESEVTTYPQGRFDQKKQQLIDSVKEEAESIGASYDEFVQTQYEMSVAEYEANLDLDVKSYLKEVLVAEAILEQEKHTITNDEYAAAINALKQQYSYESEHELKENLSETEVTDLVTIEVAKTILANKI